MKVHVKFHRTPEDSRLREYLQKRIGKIQRLLKQHPQLELKVDFVDPTGTHKTSYLDRGVIFTMDLPKGRVLRIEEAENTFERAIDFAQVRFVRQLKRWLSRHNPTKSPSRLLRSGPAKLLHLVSGRRTDGSS